MKKRFLKWLGIGKSPKREVTKEVRKEISEEFPGYHLAKNGSGRRKKTGNPLDDVIQTTTTLHGDDISTDYRTSHLLGKFPGKSLGD